MMSEEFGAQGKVKVGDVCKRLKLRSTEAMGTTLFPVGAGGLEKARRIKRDWLRARRIEIARRDLALALVLETKLPQQDLNRLSLPHNAFYRDKNNIKISIKAPL